MSDDGNQMENIMNRINSLSDVGNQEEALRELERARLEIDRVNNEPQKPEQEKNNGNSSQPSDNESTLASQ
jgi:hypothetical protein